MLFDPHKKILDLETGDPMLDAKKIEVLDERTGKPGLAMRWFALTHGIIASRALNKRNAGPNGEALPSEAIPTDVAEKRYRLATRLLRTPAGQMAELSLEEAMTIKDLVSKEGCSAAVWGQVWDALEDAASGKPNGVALRAVN